MNKLIIFGISLFIFACSKGEIEDFFQCGYTDRQKLKICKYNPVCYKRLQEKCARLEWSEGKRE